MKTVAKLALLGTCANGAAVTPVQKVLELMNVMLEKGKKEKHEEALSFNDFKQVCDDTSTEKTRAIAEANEHIGVLKADIEKAIATVEKLDKEIAELEEDISIWEGDIKASTKVREIEKSDYDKTHADYTESIDALNRAIAVLKKEAHNRPQAALIQLTTQTLIPREAKEAINQFLRQNPEDASLLEQSPPEANAYEFQ